MRCRISHTAVSPLFQLSEELSKLFLCPHVFLLSLHVWLAAREKLLISRLPASPQAVRRVPFDSNGLI